MRRRFSLMDKKKLTPKQAAFAREIAKGSNYSEAYRLTHNVKESTTAKSINTLASRLASKVEVRLRVEELQAKRERAVINSAVSDRDQVLKHLRLWITGEHEATPAQLRAADLLGRTVTGLFSDKVEIVSETRDSKEICDDIRKRLQILTGSNDVDDKKELH